MERLEVAIIGGGLLGILALRALRASGREAFLFEAHELGSGHSLHSQAYLLRGNLYVRRSKREDPIHTLVHGGLFERAGIEWSKLLAATGVQASPGTLFEERTQDATVARNAWKLPPLSYTEVSARPPWVRPDSALFDTNESFIPDASRFLQALVSAGRLERWMRRARVIKVGTDGELVVDFGGGPATLRAGAIVFAGGADRLDGISDGPARARDKRVAALVVRGIEVPDRALVTSIGIPPFGAPPARFRSRLSIMCVPRINEASGERILVCSLLLVDLDPWKRRVLLALEPALPTLDWQRARFGFYEAEFWPDAVAESDMVNVNGRILEAWPARWTLAPLAALEVARRVEEDFPSSSMSCGPPPEATPTPAVAAEHWVSVSTQTYAEVVSG